MWKEVRFGGVKSNGRTRLDGAFRRRHLGHAGSTASDSGGSDASRLFARQFSRGAADSAASTAPTSLDLVISRASLPHAQIGEAVTLSPSTRLFLGRRSLSYVRMTAYAAHLFRLSLEMRRQRIDLAP